MSDENENSEVETDAEQTEQRTDDYDGLARRIDDVLGKLDAHDAKLDSFIESVNAFMDASGNSGADDDSDGSDTDDDSDVGDIDLDTPIEDLDLSID